MRWVVRPDAPAGESDRGSPGIGPFYTGAEPFDNDAGRRQRRINGARRSYCATELDQLDDPRCTSGQRYQTSAGVVA